VSDAAVPRPRPCASCPFRRDVPSGVWSEEEYVKLLDYDGETWGQSPAVFYCHQQDGCVCSGWLAHRGDPTELLALRWGLASERLDPSCADYATDVPLFASGAEAAAHGMAEIEEPGEAAREFVVKILRGRDSDARRNKP
jgi:Family of unknown function (DUF6283)